MRKEKIPDLEIEIRAPLLNIWSALTKIDQYHQWNSVVPYGKGDLIEGNTLRVSIKLPHRDAKLGTCRVNEVKPLQYFILSRKILFPWILYMEHAFIIKKTSQREYRFQFVQTLKGSGLLWGILSNKMAKVWDHFQQMNIDLKKYLENQQQYEPSTELETNKETL